MRLSTLCVVLLSLLSVPAGAQTADLGLGLTQDGEPVTLTEQDGVYVATLSAAPFAFTLPEPVPNVFSVTFGQQDLFDRINGPAQTGLFAAGGGYAREEGLMAAHFMTDPLCASTLFGPGFNYLDAERQVAGSYPVAAIHVDSSSRHCDAEGRLPMETNLVGRVNPLYVVVAVGQRIERLILHFVGS